MSKTEKTAENQNELKQKSNKSLNSESKISKNQKLAESKSKAKIQSKTDDKKNHETSHKINHKNDHKTHHKNQEEENQKQEEEISKNISKKSFSMPYYWRHMLAIFGLFLFLFAILGGVFLNYSQTSQKYLQSDINRLQAQLDQQANDLIALENDTNPKTPELKIQNPQATTIKKPSTNERWLGDPSSRYVWVVYSDFDCPFCAKIWTDLLKAQTDQNIAIVFRHLPLTSLHPNAQKVAIASECIAKIDGNEAFFKFVKGYKIDKTITSDFSNISNFVSNETDFNNCVQQQQTVDKVLQDSNEAMQQNMNGTPTSVIYDLQTNKTQVVAGAVSYSQIVSELNKIKK